MLRFSQSSVYTRLSDAMKSQPPAALAAPSLTAHTHSTPRRVLYITFDTMLKVTRLATNTGTLYRCGALRAAMMTAGRVMRGRNDITRRASAVSRRLATALSDDALRAKSSRKSHAATALSEFARRLASHAPEPREELIDKVSGRSAAERCPSNHYVKRLP